MRNRLALGGCLAILGVLPNAARAAGIDCGKARSATEHAICASPALLALDRSIAEAYADQLAARPQAQARQELMAWLRHRDATCSVASAAMAQCLARELTARLLALAPPAAPLQREPTVPTSANPPAPAATLEQASVPAGEQEATLLHVTSPGRFTIAAHSPTGAALQLVDMLAGPSELAGVAGSQDGRLDQMLDVGTYKLRVFSAKAAVGPVSLAVTPFTDAAPPRALPGPGSVLQSDLRDGGQRGFWLVVPPPGVVRIEAAGRSLADLLLWRDGRDLAALRPTLKQTEPAPGHPLTDLLLVGKVEPGTYLAIAYGGPALRWTDNDAAQPFLLRNGASGALAEGWASGRIGAFGSEVFTLPAATERVRLDLPAAAPAGLAAGQASVGIAPNSREPSATLALSTDKPEVVELTGGLGQPFKLQALSIPPAMSVSEPGTYWVSAVTAGTGGDEVPPSVLLQRTETGDKPARIVAAAMPALSPEAAWRARFNLRGPTTLLFQNAAGGPVGVRASGLATRSERAPAGQLELPADYYALELTPVDGVQGFVDLTVGPDGRNPPPSPALPANPVLPLGVQTVAPGQSLELSALEGPGVAVGLSARAVPVALAEGPLSVTLAPGGTLSIPVRVAPGGTLAVTEGGGGPVPYTMQDARPDSGTVVLGAADRARTVVLAWRRDLAAPADIPEPPAPGDAARLPAGQPVFFDLAANEQRGFSLEVPQGGLYRVETLGRLHTSGRLATAFIPNLGGGDGNGIGRNMLIQPMLRAGRYRVEVTALATSGHLGLSASPAPLLAGATLRPGGSVRATLPAGSGASFPIEVPGEAQRYRLDVLSLGSAWSGRVDDADGWPVTNPGPLDGTTLALRPGRYRMVVAPDAVTRQVVARLDPILKPAEVTGHGPHPLAFETCQPAVWREPAGPDQPRTPDAWTFRLDGPAQVAIELGGGMVGELRREGEASRSRVAGRYEGSLGAGQYRLDVTSLGRNDRLDYGVLLSSPELQPGTARRVALPSSVPFAIADARVVSLTSFGARPVKAVLRGPDGGVARVGPRAGDWNIAVSRPLPAGRYSLDLAAAVPPDTSATAPRRDDGGGNGEDQPEDAGQVAQTFATQSTGAPHDNGDANASGDSPARDVSLTLSLPPVLPSAAAPAALTVLPGRGVHSLTLPQPPLGSLVTARARSSAAVALTLERQAAGGWRVVALDQGVAPVVASPADADPAAWRVQTWTVDAGPEPIALAAHAYDVAAQLPGPVTLMRLDDGLAAAKVRLREPSIARLADAPDGLLAGGWPGHALAAVEGGTVLPEGAEVWLLGRTESTLALTAQQMPAGQALALSLPAGLTATLPAMPAAAGHVALWRAESGLGLPGLGAGMGVATGSVVALAEGAVGLRNASGDDALRLRLTRIEATLLPPRTLQAAVQAVLAPGTALPVVLPTGDKQIRLDLAPGIAAVTNWHGPGAAAVWTGGVAVARTLSGSSTDILLVNAGAASASASLSWQPGPVAETLRAGSVVKRFFGADGSFEVNAEGAPGARLVTAGNATLTVIAADGRVTRGHNVPLRGAARVVVEHTIGAMGLWEAADGISPWPSVAAQAIQMPARLTLAGPAMALALRHDGPALLHARTSAPVLLSLAQPGRAATPKLFQAGAEFNGMLAAGPSELRLYSPHDGPLAGTLELSADPVTPIVEGLGAAVSVAPGDAAVFGFTLTQPATVGLGVRASPDRVAVRLLDASGRSIGDGVAQLRTLGAGNYMIEARVPPDAAPTTLRPALVGITPRGNGPPPEVARSYMELVGMKPQGNAP